MAVRSYLDQQIQNEAAARAAGAPVTPGSFTDIASREVNPQFVQRALGTIPANTPPPAPAFQQTFLSGLLGQLQNATPEQQQQVARFAPQIQGLLDPSYRESDVGRDEAGYGLRPDGTFGDMGGGYDPETPVGFGVPNQAFWTNEMLNARIKQLERPIKYGEKASYTKPGAMNIWDWITGAFGMETDEEESNRHKATLEGNRAFDAVQRSDEQRQQVMAGGGADEYVDPPFTGAGNRWNPS
jgi:hypothetical protein